jgi:predicted nucleic acid-binding protein
MLVVDASAIAELLLGRPAAERIALHIAAHDYALHAPHLLDVEVLSALRRLVAAGEASAARAGGAVEDLLDLPLERYPHDVLVPRAWELRENFSPYDATYVALAEMLTEAGAPLLTSDERLARAVRAHSGVEVLRIG